MDKTGIPDWSRLASSASRSIGYLAYAPGSQATASLRGRANGLPACTFVRGLEDVGQDHVLVAGAAVEIRGVLGVVEAE